MLENKDMLTSNIPVAGSDKMVLISNTQTSADINLLPLLDLKKVYTRITLS